MSSIDKILQADASYQKACPLSANAQDLFMKGHITAEEFKTISKGEAIAMSISKEPKSELQANKPVMTGTENVTDCLKMINKAKKIIDTSLETWVPKQLDHVVIRASTDKNQEVDYGLIRFTVRFLLIDVKKETMRTVGTTISLDSRIPTGNDEKDKDFWKSFAETIQYQFRNIVLTLIRCIKTDSFDKLG